jgi:FixJ family two-component response regulator
MRRSPTICIVDDDADVRSSLENFLRSAGVDVQVFGSAKEFLATGEQAGIDCLITDLHMDDMDGLALQEELNSRHRSFPVIVMTAFPTKDTEERSMRLGASAYLVKPVDPDLLLERVEAMLA